VTTSAERDTKATRVKLHTQTMI